MLVQLCDQPALKEHAMLVPLRDHDGSTPQQAAMTMSHHSAIPCHCRAGEDVHPDVLAMMKEAEAAHRAAGLEPLKAQSVPAAAELKAAAAVVVPAAAAAAVPAAAAMVAEVKQEAAPAPAVVPEVPKEKAAEPVASAPAAAPEGPKEKAAEPAEPVAAVSKPAAEPVNDASKPAAEPVAAAAAVEVAEKPARDYQRGKTGVTSIHSTYSGEGDSVME